jgi:hypothetical protein
VSAKPTARQSTCSPNFEGAGVSIITGGVEWTVSPVVAGTLLKKTGTLLPPNSTANWHVEQTGSADPTYIVKYVFLDRDKTVVQSKYTISGQSATMNWLWTSSMDN